MAVKKDKGGTRAQAKKHLSPAVPVIPKANQSDYFTKNEHFHKVKVFVKGGKQQDFDAEWRNIHVGGLKMQLHKDVPLTLEQVKRFDGEARKHWLTQRKGANIPAKEAEAKAIEAAEAAAEFLAAAKAKVADGVELTADEKQAIEADAKPKK